MIRFRCTCGRKFSAPDHLAGRGATCKSCGDVVIIPSVGTDSADALELRREAKTCPACGVVLDDATVICTECGYGLRTGVKVNTARPEDTEPAKAESRKARRLDRATVGTMLVGFSASVVVMLPPMTRHYWLSLPLKTMRCLCTLCHEIGHAAVGWLQGYPSIPTFDLQHGGGVAHRFARQPLAFLVIYLALAGFLLALRRNRLGMLAVLALAGAHAVVAFTRWGEMVFAFMGHGGELVFATLFLYRAWAGLWTFHALERVAYAFCGSFIVIKNFTFAHKLYAHGAARIAYTTAKGGIRKMDLDRIASEFLHMELGSVALFLCACCVLSVVLSFALFWYQDTVSRVVHRVTEVDPGV